MRGIATQHGRRDFTHVCATHVSPGNVLITGLRKNSDGEIAVADDALRFTSVKIIDLGLATFKSDLAHHTTTRTKRFTATSRTQRTRRWQTSSSRSAQIHVPADEIGGFKAIRAPELWPSSSIAG